MIGRYDVATQVNSGHGFCWCRLREPGGSVRAVSKKLAMFAHSHSLTPSPPPKTRATPSESKRDYVIKPRFFFLSSAIQNQICESFYRALHCWCVRPVCMCMRVCVCMCTCVLFVYHSMYVHLRIEPAETSVNGKIYGSQKAEVQ